MGLLHHHAATAARATIRLSTLPAAASAPSTMVLDAPAWRVAAATHRERVLKLCNGALAADPLELKQQRAAGLKRNNHPIYNFLFVYYSFDPNLLLRYSPGLGVTLTGVGVAEPQLYIGRGFELHDASGGSGSMQARHCKRGLRKAARTACEIMRASAGRPPHLNCYGLHEWAMLYCPDDETARPRKHQDLPLRLSQAEVNAVVEAHPIACTHFDAYRFFTPDALPLNTVRPLPTRATQPQLEQPGCVHASMDLFRYAVKLWPYLSSELLADALELALAARVLDMRASPYDVSAYHEGSGEDGALDLTPVLIETAEGRRQYQKEQVELTTRAQPLRRRMIRAYEAAFREWDEEDAEA